MQKVQGFEVIGAGFLCAIGADVEIAEIDERMGDGMFIVLSSLNVEHFLVALFRNGEVFHQGAGVAQIPQGVGQLPLTSSCAVIGHRSFPGRTSLDQVAAVQKNPRPMFMVLTHGFVNRYS